jgi:hypothetical protein
MRPFYAGRAAIGTPARAAFLNTKDDARKSETFKNDARAAEGPRPARSFVPEG